MQHTALRPWALPFGRRDRDSTRIVGWTALCVCVLAAGTYNTFAKILTGSLSPLTLFFLSELLTGFFVLLSFGVMPVLSSFVKLKRKDLLSMIAVGLTSGTMAPLLLFSGLRMSTAVNASLFGGMEPVFMLLLAVVVLGEAFGKRHLLSGAAIMLGMLVITLHGFSAQIDLNAGDALLVGSSFVFATGSILFRKYLHRVEPHLVLFARTSVAVMCFFLASPFIEHPLIEELREFPLQILPVLLGFAFISRFLNVFSFYQALDRLAVTTVSLVTNLTLIVSIALARFVLLEPVAWYHIAGGALIVLGTLWLEVAGLYPSKEHLEKHLRQRAHR